MSRNVLCKRKEQACCGGISRPSRSLTSLTLTEFQIQPVCVCVCVCERERERERGGGVLEVRGRMAGGQSQASYHGGEDGERQMTWSDKV